MIRARCRDCGKTYRVPDSARDRHFECKACGGAVAALDAAPKEPEREEAPEHEREPDVPPAVPGSKRNAAIAAGLEAESRARLVASRKLGSAMRVITVVRALYVAYAVLTGVGVAVLLLAMVGGSDEDPESLVVTLIAFSSACAFVTAGAVFMRRQPVVWSVAIAAVATLNAATALLTPARERRAEMGVFLAFLLWGAVAAVVKAKKTLAEHPDLWASKRLRAEPRATKGGEVYAASRETARRDAARSRNLSLLYTGVAVAGLALVAFALDRLGGSGDDSSANAAATAPPSEPLDPVAARFRDAWNASRVDEISMFYKEDSRAKMGRVFGRMLERKGWNPTLPRLGAPDIAPGKRGTCQAFFPLEAGGGIVQTTWQFAGVAGGRPEWILRSLKEP